MPTAKPGILPNPGTVALTAAERRRITAELNRIKELGLAGIRGTSQRSVTRFAISKFGAEARKKIRGTTPRRTGQLARATKGAIGRARSGPIGKYQVWYRAGWTYGGISRFQQGLAVEYGLKTRSYPATRVIRRALSDTIGAGGARFKREVIRLMHQRIDALARRANTRGRAR